VIGSIDDVQGGARQPRGDPLDASEVGELVARALHEQHRHVDGSEVLGARVRRVAGPVQREAEEHQAANAA